jgi:periplasmic copper chaperone A
MMKNVPLTVLFAAVLVSACDTATTPPAPLPPVAVAGDIAISEPRMRLPPPGSSQTAAYLTLTNNGNKADRLVGATSSQIGKIELHAHVKSADGLMGMRALNAIDVPAHTTIPLSPGGLHLMAKDVAAGLDIGDTVAITVTFASGKKAQFLMPVVSNPRHFQQDKKVPTAHEHQH